MLNYVVTVWILHMHLSPVEGLTEPHQSSRKHRVVGFLVTQKDLEDPASYLGVRMHEYSKRKVI